METSVRECGQKMTPGMRRIWKSMHAQRKWTRSAFKCNKVDAICRYSNLTWHQCRRMWSADHRQNESSRTTRAERCDTALSSIASVTVPFDSIHFRHVLGHVPTSVVVVTGCSSEGIPAGVTIGSLISVSLVPPLVGFFQEQSNRSMGVNQTRVW